MNELPKLEPIPILLTTYNRLNFLKRTIDAINSRTLYPFYLFVIDNNSTDGTKEYLKTAKVNGKLFDILLLDENIGQSRALNKVFSYMESWQQKRPMSDFVVSTNDDLICPNLRPCWLEQMIDIFKRHEEEGLGALAMRIQRMARADIKEDEDIIYWNKGIPSVFRLMRRSDLRQLGDRPFGRLTKWDSNSMADKYKFFIKKRYGITSHLYADHIGFMAERKGYDEGVETFTVAENKINERNDKPYPDINSETNVPVKINHPCDAIEHKLRQEHQAIVNGDIKKEVTLIVLTYHRINGLKRIIDSIKKYTTDTLYDLLVVIDNDDTESYQWCLEQNIKCILSSWNRDFVSQANLGIYICQTPYFILLSDDAEIIEPNWLSKSLKIYKDKFRNNLGILAFNDGIQKGKVFIFGLISKKLVNFFNNNLYCVKYGHYGADRELVYLAKAFGYYFYEDSIHILHDHPGKNGIKDDIYKLSENNFWKQDQELKKYRRNNVDIIREKNYCDYL